MKLWKYSTLFNWTSISERMFQLKKKKPSIKLLVAAKKLWLCAGPRFSIKMTSCQYGKSHCGDKSILRPSHLHNGISYTDEMTSLYWIGALVLCVIIWLLFLCDAINHLARPLTFLLMCSMPAMNITVSTPRPSHELSPICLEKTLQYDKVFHAAWH